MRRQLLIISLLLGGYCSSCQRAIPPLIDVHDLSPSDFEPHDRLTIRGEGFPESAAARITFEGSVRRNGEAPDGNFQLQTTGRSDGSSTIEFSLDDELAALLVGDSRRTRHATFTGQLTVAFAPRVPGAPPIVGSKRVSFDVYPGLPGADEDAEVKPLATFLGGELTALGAGKGLRVGELVGEGRLATAGIRTGDVILQGDGLNTRRLADLKPYPGQSEAWLTVERPGLQEPLGVSVDVSGFAPQTAGRWLWGLGLLAAVAAGILTSKSPLARWIALLTAARQRDRPRPLTPRLAIEPRRAPSTPDGFGVFLGVSALFAVVGVRAAPWLKDFELLLGALCATCFWLLGRLLIAGNRGRRWSLATGLGGALSGLVSPAILLACLATVVLQTNSLSLTVTQPPDDVPLLFTPGGYLSCLTIVGLMVVAALSGSPTPSRAGVTRLLGPPSAKREPYRALQQVYCLMLGGMVIALFLGGWNVPAWMSQGSTLTLGALVFQAKLATLYALLSLLSQRIQPMLPRYLSGAYFRYLLPGGLLSVVITPVWQAPAWPDWLRQSAALGLMALTGMIAFWVVYRLVLARRRGVQTVAVNPWM
jgi:hypothetical protein